MIFRIMASKELLDIPNSAGIVHVNCLWDATVKKVTISYYRSAHVYSGQLNIECIGWYSGRVRVGRVELELAEYKQKSSLPKFMAYTVNCLFPFFPPSRDYSECDFMARSVASGEFDSEWRVKHPDMNTIN